MGSRATSKKIAIQFQTEGSNISDMRHCDHDFINIPRVSQQLLLREKIQSYDLQNLSSPLLHRVSLKIWLSILAIDKNHLECLLKLQLSCPPTPTPIPFTTNCNSLAMRYSWKICIYFRLPRWLYLARFGHTAPREYWNAEPSAKKVVSLTFYTLKNCWGDWG